MRKQLAVTLAMVALSGACKPADRDTGAVDNDRSGTDTAITSETCLLYTSPSPRD